MVRVPTLIYFYRKRLRVHAMQELLAGLGIATGVALVFAVQIANSSVTGSARQILHGITGNASLQLVTREPHGFAWSTYERVRTMPGVEHVSAVLEQRASLTYRGRRTAVDLVGVDSSLPSLGGFAARYFHLGGLVLQRGILLPGAVGAALGIKDGDHLPVVHMGVRGQSKRVAVSAVLDSGAIGSLSGSLLGVVSLGYAQELTGLGNRVSRILVIPVRGRERAVRAGLERIAGGRLTVNSVDAESRALDQATGPIDQSTGLFAAISAFVGLLFAFTAMLLTAPERRRFVADLRIMGFRRTRVVQILGFQAVSLGLVASLIGLLGGYVLATTAQQAPPGYLTFAFPLGIQRVIDAKMIALALAGGIVATCLAAAQPLLDLRRSQPINAVFAQRGEPGHAVRSGTRRTLAAGSIALTIIASILLLLVPSLTVLGVAAIAIATVLAVPLVLATVLRLVDGPAIRLRLNALTLATRALRATSMRSLALAATGAVAVFGSVAIQGARHDLLHGLYGDYREYVGTADIWIAHPQDDLALQPFDPRGVAQRIASVAGVRSVRPYFGGLLDLGNRRVWIIARPPDDRTMVPPSQLVSGDRATANARLATGGWVAVSQQVAAAQGVGVGDRVTLPTPTGDVSYRVAATTTNLGWGPGAVVLNSVDYRRAWASDSPSALEVTIGPGSDLAATKHAIHDALGPGSSLSVQTTGERSRHANAIAREGLARLSQISTLLLVAATIAMAAAMGAGIWQRRVVLAQLQIMGWRPRKLWRALLLETAIVLGTGCLVGAVAGVYGHLLLDRWLQLSTGYPAPFVATGWQAVAVCMLVASAALAVTAVPGYLVSRTPPRFGLATRT